MGVAVYTTFIDAHSIPKVLVEDLSPKGFKGPGFGVKGFEGCSVSDLCRL